MLRRSRNMSKTAFLALSLAGALISWTSSQPMVCQPCSCYHDNITTSLTINCYRDAQKLDWDPLPHVETFANFENSHPIGFHLLPFIWRNLTTEMKISHSSLDDLDLMGYFVIRSLIIDNSKILSGGHVLNAPLSLKNLSITNSGLTDFTIPQFNALLSLDLSHNVLTKIPIVQNLQRLTLSNTSLLSFTTTVCEPMDHLSYLDLSFNRIRDVPESALKCIAVHDVPLSLNLSHNGIRTIHERAFTGLLLREIDLSSNKLQVLSVGVLDFRSIDHLDLQNNHWLCDCNAQWLLDELTPHLYKSNKSDLLYDFRCYTPKRFEHRSLAFWYNRSSEVFCGNAPVYSYNLPYSDTKYELWTGQMIVCIVLGCLIACLGFAIIGAWLWPKGKKTKKPPQQRKPRPLSSNPRYSQVGMQDVDKF